MHAVITGANRGIGQALDHILQAQGHRVTGASRAGSGFLSLDVTDPASQLEFARALDAQPVDLLICNAGVYLDKGQNLADGYEATLWADTFAANVTGVFLTVQALLPNLQLSPAPKIAIISSQMGSSTKIGGGSYIYRASKAAALNLGLNLAEDLKHIDIAVGIYHPGWVQTDMGGTQAALSVTDSAQGLANRFEALTLETTGCFENWDGTAHAI
ncbi:SDR family oxidoreductase [Shimia sp. NS0008-38b]|uniref:SDR family NAD(P)-dependent oxidoreductase n=1 Tax=Shimia sp. NS0008-38b TaxID=3127653 RepID=UPI00310B1998